MPSRKRESEWQAYQELRADYSDGEIADCLVAVRSEPLPGGDACHSPMAYLAIAMGDLLNRARARKATDEQRAEAAKSAAEQTKQRAAEEAAVEQEHERNEEAFRHFVGERDEAEVVAEICRRLGFPMTAGRIGRSFAVAHWQKMLSPSEATA